MQGVDQRSKRNLYLTSCISRLLPIFLPFCYQNIGGKREIILFATFRTRHEAMMCFFFLGNLHN